ncbi:hypothetical protein OIU77_001249 [Salix suchowensis]|uniref:NB-ARC domain-containing protein n=1 Tax=Salix suchowensis TaxID=1278906 RepID=A0ABQ9B0T5_9ROSI|nr:hypothetical protein OIU77_001249 [Salix suchowensis]
MLESRARSLHLTEQRPSHERVPVTSLLAHPRVFGRDQYKEDIKKSLLSDDAEGESLQVIPIVGRPGIGKTTLARFVYHDDAVQKWFDLKAWVSVSQDLDVLKLTKNILKELGFSDCDSMPPNRLHCKLQEILKGNKLLLVLDDFWNDDPEECTFVITPLMAGAKGSKIIITTRERSGASSALQTLHPYLLQTLHPFLLPGISDDNCLLVFSEHAFSGPSCNARLQFENMFSSSVVRRCKGLPLTAKLLGGLLKSKTNVDEWRKILDSNIWDLRDDRGLPVLKVSYYCLPSHLRRCFAYCAILPKSHAFCKEEVVLLWMAEGFLLACGGNKEMKKAGYKYFEDLVSMSFFEQVSDNSPLFVMHDLTNDLAKFVSGEFAVCLDDGDSWKVSKKTRHVSYARTRSEDLNRVVGFDEVPNLRTLLLISRLFLANTSDEEIGDFLGRFQRLRVLSFLHGDTLPSSIGNLKQLWYLNLSGSSEHRLPETLCTLHNLQILILHGCNNLMELPTNLMKLINLFHLDIKGTRLQQMPPQMGKLSKLQTLTDFFVGRQNGSSIKELGELKCLEGKLRIWMLQNVDDAQDALGANLEGMRDLKKLDLRWSDDAYGSLDERVIHQLKPPVNLCCLVIVGYGGSRFPTWLTNSCLVDLRLSECHCSSLPPLGQLAFLKKLLIKAFDKVESVGCEFYRDCTSTSIPFNSLESLTFERMQQWCEWNPDVARSDQDRSFPCLQVLCISECPKLKGTLPSHLPSLKELTITECSQFVLSLPRPTTIMKMSLRDTSNDHPDHMVKLEKLNHGWQSLIVKSCNSDSLLKEMEQQGYFLTIQEMSIHCSSLRCFPVEHFPKLKQLDISGCSNLESLCLSDGASTSTSPLKLCEGSNMEDLSLFDCSSLKSVDCSLPSLVALKISCCRELGSFPALGLSSSPGVCLSSKLKSLDVHDCPKLLAHLEEMDLDVFSLECYELTHLPM